ncbi:MAG: hypothetical protein HOP29_18400 [Phycisphaerales bacterium]|nr:hypothetical protein [Phycisphaerales bacterium]
MTTLEALGRFAKTLAEQPLPDRAPEPATLKLPQHGTRNAARREREIQHAEAECKRRGIL